ncbi:MAG: cupredoxin domain-containing protein [Chloroflexi bacterium]|nr:cupredoxin domain-containing protein [Chloroflexota bacterium]
MTDPTIAATSAPSLSGAGGGSATPQVSADATLSPGSPSASAGADGSGVVIITAKDVAFVPTQVNVPAGKPFTIRFENQDPVPHNVAIFRGADASGTQLFRGEIFAGPRTVDYRVPALKPGSYFFYCEVHPTMTGTITTR